MKSAHRSPIMMDGAFVFPLTTVGITDASGDPPLGAPSGRAAFGGFRGHHVRVPVLQVPEGIGTPCSMRRTIGFEHVILDLLLFGREKLLFDNGSKSRRSNDTAC